MLLVKRKEQKDEKKLQLKTFRKNIIQLLIFLGIVTFLSSSQKYIPYTRQEIIVQDIALFLLYLVLSIVIDIINEKKTWLWITAMSERPEQMHAVIDRKLTDYLKIQEIRAIYDELGLAGRSHELIERYAADAMAALRQAGLSAQAEAFFGSLASGLSTRTH